MTMMNSLNPNQDHLHYHYTTFLLLTLLHLLCSPAASSLAQSGSAAPLSPPLDHHQGILMEGKSRLGSTPPSCHNRCNSCNPCNAVQVPTIPIRERSAKPGSGRMFPAKDEHEKESKLLHRTARNEYTNYKPLGWKCRCRDHLFNP